jgi:hypothetical protein
VRHDRGRRCRESGDLDGLEAICDDVAALVGEHRARRGNGSTGARAAIQAGAAE